MKSVMNGMNIKIQLAEKSIELLNISRETMNRVRSYETEGNTDFSVQITEADLLKEQEIYSERNGNVSDHVFESLAVYRKIAEKMIDYDTLLFHGSCLCMNGNGYMFCADSGTGKSTHTRMWREYFGERVYMINDDKPLIHVGDSVIAYGTPWSGKHHLDADACAALKGICFLYRDTVNHIERIPGDTAVPYLLKYCYRSTDSIRVQKTMEMLVTMAEKVPMYTLGCTISHEAAEIAYEGMREGI